MGPCSVKLPHRIVAGLRRHAVATLPAECCGALVGLSEPRQLEVRAAIPLLNEERAVDRYSIDARVVLHLERQAAAAGVRLLGFYHSHPLGSAAPSPVDVEFACPGFLYLIIQPHHGSLRGWRLRDDRLGFTELPLEGAA
jgi:proteasome lid subunit RPN8/RPN11